MTYDFLSSIEMTYLHQADVLYMQNWDHVTDLFKNLNLMPKSNHDTDFSRVRPYFLEGKAGEHNQLVVTSKFNDPLIWSVFRRYGKSVAGHVRFKAGWGDVGCLGGVTSSVKQIFQVIPCPDPMQQESIRFDYFKKNVLGPMLRLNQTRTLIVTPSYISYIKVRNELMREEANAAFVCEYSRESEISRGRSRFFHGDKNIMLYSGRAHFFRRFLIKGACHVVFYSLPEYAHFYPELVNTIQESEDASGTGNGNNKSSISCTVLYTKFEKLALERIVGAKRCEHMLSSSKSTFMFC
jgi:U3 small nucleolar RNA-associated protein 25